MAWLFGQWSQSPHWVLLPCPSGAPGGDRAGDRVCLRVASGKRHLYVEKQTEFAPQQHPEYPDGALHSGFR